MVENKQQLSIEIMAYLAWAKADQLLIFSGHAPFLSL
jgi:hypothetical protein